MGGQQERHWIAQLSTTVRTLPRPLLAWCLVLLLQPFYVFKSGLPQPADVLLVGLALVMNSSAVHLSPSQGRAFRWLVAFCCWITVVNLMWSVLNLGDGSNLRIPTVVMPAFYWFNTISLWCVFQLTRRYNFLAVQVTFYSMAVSVITQAALAEILSVTAGRVRAQLFFNNPNQLGYFAVLASCFVAIGARLVDMPRPFVGIAMVASSFLGLISLSKSAMLSSALLLIVTVVRRPSVVLAGLVVLGISTAVVDWDDVLSRAQTRLGSIGADSDDNLAGRGYDRIWLHPEHLLLGAGEGSSERFGTEMYGEIHSSYGTIAFSYGFPGVILFCGFMISLLRGIRWIDLLFYVPALAYGFTHQGLRFRPFWILLATLPWLAAMQRRRRRP